jgi:hypothetical protein
MLELSSVLAPTDALKAALSEALRSFDDDADLAPLVRPVENVSWVSCDGGRKGTALLEGARNLNARATIELIY